MIDIDDVGISGHFKIIEVNKETGERKTVVDDENKIVSTGFQSLLSGVSRADQVPYGFSGLVLGNDTGTGNIDNPESAREYMSPSDQSVVYQIPKGDVYIDYPSPFKVRFTTVIDGDDLYRKTNNPRNMFTSASIRNNRGEIVAYKRFGGRTSSPLLAFNIMWTISITPVGTIGIPQPIIPDGGGEDSTTLGIIFYAMRDINPNLTSLNPIAPEELTDGNGQYSKSFDVPNGNTSVYVIALMDVGEDELVAVEWDGDTPITDGISLSYESDMFNIETVKSYILKVTPLGKKEGSIGVCMGFTCADIWIKA